MIRPLLILLICLVSLLAEAQEKDSVQQLQQIEVKGLDIKTTYQQVPSSIHVLRQKDLTRFSNTSLIPVLNTVPGVRMEERSPGSYRLSIRGSLLRSPFGVRNIKVYWKDIPLTDAGGNTYINLLDLNAIGGIEVLKGPAGSIYGAGTGGVVSFNGLRLGDSSKNGGMVQLATGSYSTQNGTAAWQWNGPKGSLQVYQSYQQAEGYRRNSAMKRAFTQLSGQLRLAPVHQMDYLVVYSDLQYQTPGGLTLAQFLADPKQARPATATLPSAEQQKAAIYNKTFLVGLTNSIQLNHSWQQVSTISFSLTKFDNPFITNYEKRNESNFALRNKWIYTKNWSGTKLNYIVGFEAIDGRYRIDSSGNRAGDPTGVTARDKVNAHHNFIFTQGQLNLHNKVILNTGISWNSFGYELKRMAPTTYHFTPTFNKALLPRLAILAKIKGTHHIHFSLSKGYSSPTLAEIKPSAGGFYGGLQAEYGWNKEIGLRGQFGGSRFRYDVSAFDFELKQAIVRQVDNQGAEYFVNAGRVSQKGIEIYLEGNLVQQAKGILRSIRLMNSSSFSHFRFTDYRSGSVNFAGNKLTGVPAQVINTGIDLGFGGGIYVQGNYLYTGKLPLTDANDTFASDYRLLQIRAGWKHNWNSKLQTELFFSGDNLLDEQYSLGNDINAFGRRYYNPAAPANWISGIKLIF